jgi:hypothetical protein
MKSNEQVKIRPNPETAPEANDLLAAAAERARLASYASRSPMPKRSETHCYPPRHGASQALFEHS